MVGLFAYPPNEDGARFFVADVLPLVRAALPKARLRLVGRDGGAIDDLAGQPGVELVGEVADIGAELRRADVVAVPLRYGGGTRVKILEALAYRVPVVSTSVGCEGLDLVPGEHLLVADDAAGFAEACVEVARDAARRQALTDAAFAVFEARYRSDVVATAVESLATQVMHGQ
jgi:glycosyltransferase involved in cell wall biosynthesis